MLAQRHTHSGPPVYWPSTVYELMAYNTRSLRRPPPNLSVIPRRRHPLRPAIPLRLGSHPALRPLRHPATPSTPRTLASPTDSYGRRCPRTLAPRPSRSCLILSPTTTAADAVLHTRPPMGTRAKLRARCQHSVDINTSLISAAPASQGRNHRSPRTHPARETRRQRVRGYLGHQTMPLRIHLLGHRHTSGEHQAVRSYGCAELVVNGPSPDSGVPLTEDTSTTLLRLQRTPRGLYGQRSRANNDTTTPRYGRDDNGASRTLEHETTTLDAGRTTHDLVWTTAARVRRRRLRENITPSRGISSRSYGRAQRTSTRRALTETGWAQEGLSARTCRANLSMQEFTALQVSVRRHIKTAYGVNDDVDASIASAQARPTRPTYHEDDGDDNEGRMEPLGCTRRRRHGAGGSRIIDEDGKAIRRCGRSPARGHQSSLTALKVNARRRLLAAHAEVSRDRTTTRTMPARKHGLPVLTNEDDGGDNERDYQPMAPRRRQRPSLPAHGANGMHASRRTSGLWVWHRGSLTQSWRQRIAHNRRGRKRYQALWAAATVEARRAICRRRIALVGSPVSVARRCPVSVRGMEWDGVRRWLADIRRTRSPSTSGCAEEGSAELGEGE
ncbi:hypothetical protein BJ912DRAFT_1059404 [Pholiota molesta]|nr:hypothetical protein BJ912DRAFT_1059404 [Pholiota molesta]